jgi:hypothetical protein
LLAGGLLRQGVDLDDIGAPIRELPHAGRPGADAGETEHGEAGKSLRGVREGHSDISWPELPCGFNHCIKYLNGIASFQTHVGTPTFDPLYRMCAKRVA